MTRTLHLVEVNRSRSLLQRICSELSGMITMMGIRARLCCHRSNPSSGLPLRDTMAEWSADVTRVEAMAIKRLRFRPLLADMQYLIMTGG
jgi:hypothetical protein